MHEIVLFIYIGLKVRRTLVLNKGQRVIKTLSLLSQQVLNFKV